MGCCGGRETLLDFLGNFCWLRSDLGHLCQLVKINNEDGNRGWGARSQRRGGFPKAPGTCAGSSGSPESPAWHLPLEPQPAGASFLGWERQNSRRRRAPGHRPLAPHRQALLGLISGLFGVEQLACSSRGKRGVVCYFSPFLFSFLFAQKEQLPSGTVREASFPPAPSCAPLAWAGFRGKLQDDFGASACIQVGRIISPTCFLWAKS